MIGLDLEEALNRAVAEQIEPEPPPVAASALRATYREWTWANYNMHPSPGRWWEANIGSDHGPPEADDDPVHWQAARDPVNEIADAWAVHIVACHRPADFRERYFHALQEQTKAYTNTPDGAPWPEVLVVLRYDLPIAICRAFLSACGITLPR